jgi:hypothetical protein
MSYITIEADITTEVDINIDEHRDELIAALDLEASEFVSEVYREFQLFGPKAAISAVEDAIYKKLGFEVKLID